jgi:hypothetical protein
MPQRQWRRRRVYVGLLVSALAVMALGALSGCQVAFGPQVTIRGVVYGEQVAAREAGKSVPTPLSATVTCNGAATTSDSKGGYSFSVPKADTYTCNASAPNYTRVTATVVNAENSIALNFGPRLIGYCDHTDPSGAITCGLLTPAVGTLRGTAVDAASDQALPHVEVYCWNAAMDMVSGAHVLYTTYTDETGVYVIHNLPADPYICVADHDQAAHTTIVIPGQTTSLDISACESNCPHFGYHLDGKVIHKLTVYLIFWLPDGYTFEPNGSSSRYQHLMEQYFQDVGGTPFYNILTQYYDTPGGPVRNTVTLGGSYVDSHPYPRAGTISHPLLDIDIVHEINRVLNLKKSAWPMDDDHLVFLFTASGVQECAGASPNDGCTFTHNREADFCAYHYTSFDVLDPTVSEFRYAYIPDIESCTYLPTAHSPNGDPTADAIISIVSHEQFEAVSDPDMQSWYDNSTFEGEMADKCVTNFGPIRADGSNVTLAHDHRYIVQEEWSLHDQACVLSYAPSPGS